MGMAQRMVGDQMTGARHRRALLQHEIGTDPVMAAQLNSPGLRTSGSLHRPPPQSCTSPWQSPCMMQQTHIQRGPQDLVVVYIRTRA